ncbi:MAG: sugar ABC transporter ATP-binding protein [Treponema sp.]|nr:sugar ABC transporter ATP-binding protein [Treponema sp.]
MGSYVQIRGISKRFHSVVALNKVSLDINSGETHVVIGENGAGKSTLMKILAGLYRPDEGQILIDGREAVFSSPLDAIADHISMIHQELLLVPYLTVAENIFLGREPRNRAGLLEKKRLYEDAKELLKTINITIDPYAPMHTLSVAQKQLAEIAKAVSFNSKLLIMDEPTSALSDKEIAILYELIFRLKSEGRAVVFISHKLDEVLKVADTITVLRDGEHITTEAAGRLNKDQIISLMIGRELKNVFVKTETQIGEPILEIRGLTRRGEFEDINFTLRKNEILGIAGLLGAGRTELVETIFGLRKADRGEVFIKGKLVPIRDPWDAQKHGIALIPEDRKLMGLNLKDTTGFNISLCHLGSLSRYHVLIKKRETELVNGMIKQMSVKVPSYRTPVVSLSGGNQQKVVIAKWLMTGPDILVMDEPTRGIDVGAKAEIYKLIVSLAREGKSIIMVSSELPEIIGLSDRIIVLCEGRLTGELTREAISQQAIMKLATEFEGRKGDL